MDQRPTILGPQHDAIGMVETHQPHSYTDELLKKWKQANFKAVVSPAQPTGRSKEGTSGGVVLGVRTKHQAVSFRPLAQKEEQQKGMMDHQHFQAGPINFEDFAMMSWRLKGHSVTLAVAYLTDKIKKTGRNLSKTKQYGSSHPEPKQSLDHYG